MPGVGLRARLALFFVAITVVPLTVAVVGLQFQIRAESRERAADEFRLVGRSASAFVEAERRRAGDLADDLLAPDTTGTAGGTGLAAALAAADTDAIQAWLEGVLPDLENSRADLVVVAGPDGALLGSVASEPEFAPGVDVRPAPAAIAEAVRTRVPPAGVLLETREIRAGGNEGAVLGYLISGLWADRQLLDLLRVPVGTAFLAGEEVLAADGGTIASLPQGPLPDQGDIGPVTVDGGDALAAVIPLGSAAGGDVGGSPSSLLLWSPLPVSPYGPGLVLALLAIVVIVSGSVGWILAGGVVAPVRRAADVARAVAGGDLQQRLAPSGGRELADLATALNTMAAVLSDRLAELQRSKEELRGSLSRLGQTLSSSLDLNRTLAVMVETVMITLSADRAVLMLLTPERDALYVKVGRGIGSPVRRLGLGEGLAGWVARTGTPVRLPDDRSAAPPPAEGELAGPHQLAVPLLGRGQAIGVLSLVRDEGGLPFTQDDLETISSFGTQASVAIENVMLHQEARRLSVTDPLTGLWNFRYFQIQADRELESASRSSRPLSLVILDIDKFKHVNDTQGHQVGDEVLIEVARRIRDSTRVPDVVARYGGEEFVVLLPGTGLDGAVATAERIRLAVYGDPVVVDLPSDGDAVGPLQVSCSGGVASFPDHGRTVAGLLRTADAAMYLAKTRGRNRVFAAGSAGIVAPGETGASQSQA